MPRTIIARPTNTVNVVADDILTIQFNHTGQFALLNYGPGNIWLTWEEGVDPAIGAEHSMLLKGNVSKLFEGGKRARKIDLKIIADAATTITFSQR